ncbi:MAG: hypothetical protein M3619_15790 [Myxococcota bacterium]|nr:hypothetical protein [Myxococcota bacterium]
MRHSALAALAPSLWSSLVLALGSGLGFGCAGDAPPNPNPGTIDAPPNVTPDAPSPDAAKTTFSFFITSTGGPNGGNLGGLVGADEICRTKAVAALPEASTRTWRAYLSTDAENAKDRIGAGPWFNRAGVMVASSVANLHDAAANMLTKASSTDETGAVVNGSGDNPNQHDILTGSTVAGVSSGNHCANWTSAVATGVTAQVGHHDRIGGGANPTSWNAAHATSGCSAAAFAGSGGRGSFYCFASD